MRKVVVGLVVLALLLVAADRVAAALVENRLADRVDAKEGVSGSQVDITGFPFLTQVLQNHFDKIDVSLPTLSAGSGSGNVLVEQLHVTLHDVTTADRYTKATAASVTGSGTIPYDSFAGDAITISYGGQSANGSGLLDISLPGLSQSIQVSPELAEGQTLELGAVGSQLPPPIQSFLAQRYGFSGLPSGITVQRLRATPHGLVVTVVGTDVEMAG